MSTKRRFYQAVTELARCPAEVAGPVFDELLELTRSVLVAVESGDVEAADEVFREAQARVLLASALGRGWQL